MKTVDVQARNFSADNRSIEVELCKNGGSHAHVVVRDDGGEVQAFFGLDSDELRQIGLKMVEIADFIDKARTGMLIHRPAAGSA